MNTSILPLITLLIIRKQVRDECLKVHKYWRWNVIVCWFVSWILVILILFLFFNFALKIARKRKREGKMGFSCVWFVWFQRRGRRFKEMFLYRDREMKWKVDGWVGGLALHYVNEWVNEWIIQGHPAIVLLYLDDRQREETLTAALYSRVTHHHSTQGTTELYTVIHRDLPIGLPVW